MIGLGVVGVVGLGAGTVLGLMAKSKYDDSKEHCRPADENLCAAQGVELRDDALLTRKPVDRGLHRRRRRAGRRGSALDREQRLQRDGARPVEHTPGGPANESVARSTAAPGELLMSRARRKIIALAALGSALYALGACNAVLGMEEAELDEQTAALTCERVNRDPTVDCAKDSCESCLSSCQDVSASFSECLDKASCRKALINYRTCAGDRCEPRHRLRRVPRSYGGAGCHYAWAGATSSVVKAAGRRTSFRFVTSIVPVCTPSVRTTNPRIA